MFISLFYCLQHFNSSGNRGSDVAKVALIVPISILIIVRIIVFTVSVEVV